MIELPQSCREERRLVQPRSERLRISKRSKPYSSLRATRAAQIAKGTSVSDRMSADSYPQIQGPGKAERLSHIDPRWASWNLGVFVCIRYEMIRTFRKLAAWVLIPLKVFWHTSRNGHAYQPSKVSGPGRLDGRAVTECTTLG